MDLTTYGQQSCECSVYDQCGRVIQCDFSTLSSLTLRVRYGPGFLFTQPDVFCERLSLREELTSALFPHSRMHATQKTFGTISK